MSLATLLVEHKAQRLFFFDEVAETHSDPMARVVGDFPFISLNMIALNFHPAATAVFLVLAVITRLELLTAAIEHRVFLRSFKSSPSPVRCGPFSLAACGVGGGRHAGHPPSL